MPCKEEVGTRGAQTATQMIKPDVFIAVDCSPCSDTYKPSETGGSLGKGFMVRFYDPGIIMHQGAYKYVTEIANKNNISYQLYRAKGGTDAVKAQYADAGAISFTIGMPARYIHTTASMISLKDYLEVKKELKAIIYDLDEAKINKIREE